MTVAEVHPIPGNSHTQPEADETQSEANNLDEVSQVGDDPGLIDPPPEIDDPLNHFIPSFQRIIEEPNSEPNWQYFIQLIDNITAAISDIVKLPPRTERNNAARPRIDPSGTLSKE